MAKEDFIPKRDGDLDMFEENFLNKLSEHAPAPGIDHIQLKQFCNVAISLPSISYTFKLTNPKSEIPNSKFVTGLFDQQHALSQDIVFSLKPVIINSA